MDKSDRRVAWERECSGNGICPDCFHPLLGNSHTCRARDRKAMKHLGDYSVGLKLVNGCIEFCSAQESEAIAEQLGILGRPVPTRH